MTAGFRTTGGEGGIRTLGTGVSPYNGLANRRIRPLCHLSGGRNQNVETTYVVYHFCGTSWSRARGVVGDSEIRSRPLPPADHMIPSSRSRPFGKVGNSADQSAFTGFPFDPGCWKSVPQTLDLYP